MQSIETFDIGLARQFAEATWAFIDRSDEASIRKAQSSIRIPDTLQRAVEKRRLDFMLGRYAAVLALEQLGHACAEIGINADRSPQWPEGLTGSISHCQDLAVAMVTAKNLHTSLGIDVEMLLNDSDAQAIKDQIVGAEEFVKLSRDLSDWTEAQILTLTFSAKESLYKCLAPIVGRFFDFKAAHLEVVHASRGEFRVTLVEDLAPPWGRGKSLQGYWFLHGTHILTVLAL